MNAPELNTALHRVEQLLQNSEQGLTIQKITQLANVTEKEAQNSIKALHAMGQIEMIPTPGRWGNRYAWLSTKPVEVPAEVTGDGSGEALPELPDDDDAEFIDALFPADLPCLVENIQDDLAQAFAEANLEMPAVLSAYRELVESQAVARQPVRYAVAVPKRPLRIVKSRERAEAMALAAVRNGAKGAEVFALQPIGKAARGAEWRSAT